MRRHQCGPRTLACETHVLLGRFGVTDRCTNLIMSEEPPEDSDPLMGAPSSLPGAPIDPGPVDGAVPRTEGSASPENQGLLSPDGRHRFVNGGWQEVSALPAASPPQNESAGPPESDGEGRSSSRIPPPGPAGWLFTAPPGWPPAPAGWRPAEGWAPPDAWPPPPENWKFWVEASSRPLFAEPERVRGVKRLGSWWMSLEVWQNVAVIAVAVLLAVGIFKVVNHTLMVNSEAYAQGISNGDEQARFYSANTADTISRSQISLLCATSASIARTSNEGWFAKGCVKGYTEGLPSSLLR